MINYENVCAMYSEGELLAPINNIKQTTEAQRAFTDVTIEKIMACIRPGRANFVTEICKKLKLSQSSVRRYCKHMKDKGLIHGQPADEKGMHCVFAYYLIGDSSIPVAAKERNEKLVLDVIRHNKGITKLQIRKELKLTEYNAEKALTSLRKQKKVKVKNIAGDKVGNRMIYAYSIA